MRLVALFLVLFTTGCADDIFVPPPVQYDLVFEGDNESGLPLLFRASLNDLAPHVVGSGFLGRDPAPSPDGRALVFHSVDSETVASELMLLESGATEPAAFHGGTGASDREAAWSPDGTQIAFLSNRDDPTYDVFAAAVSGGRLSNLRNLTPTSPSEEWWRGREATPAWSPDGAHIAFTSYRSGGASIWTVSTDGTGPWQVTNSNDGNSGDYFPSWSPDGRWIAFQRIGAEGARIGIVAVEGGSPRFIATFAEANAPAWSPEGDKLAVSAVAEGERDIFVISPDGQVLSRIRRVGEDRNPAWAKQGL